MKASNSVLTQSHASARRAQETKNLPAGCLPIEATAWILCDILGRHTVPIAPLGGVASLHSLALTWLTASSLKLNTNRRLALKIKTTFPQKLDILPWYRHSRRGVEHKENSLHLEKKKRQSFGRAATRSSRRIRLHLWRCRQGSPEYMSRFNMLRATAYSSVYWQSANINRAAKDLKGQASEIIENLNLCGLVQVHSAAFKDLGRGQSTTDGLNWLLSDSPDLLPSAKKGDLTRRNAVERGGKSCAGLTQHFTDYRIALHRDKFELLTLQFP